MGEMSLDTARLIEYIKNGVGQGESFQNDVVCGVFSSSGFWCQVIAVPEDFVGAYGQAPERSLYEFVDSSRVLKMVEAIEQAKNLFISGIGNMELLLIYEPITSRNDLSLESCIICCPGKNILARTPLFRGRFRYGEVPRFFKLKICRELAQEVGLSGEFRRFVFVAEARPNQVNPHLLFRVSGEATDIKEGIVH